MGKLAQIQCMYIVEWGNFKWKEAFELRIIPIPISGTMSIANNVFWMEPVSPEYEEIAELGRQYAVLIVLFIYLFKIS